MRGLRIKDRVRLRPAGGGPTNGGAAEYYEGTLIDFIAGQNIAAAAVLKLDRSITRSGITGNMLVLELSYLGACWAPVGTVHAELRNARHGTPEWRQRLCRAPIGEHFTYEQLMRRSWLSRARAFLDAVPIERRHEAGL